MTRDEILSIFKRSHALLDGHFQLTSGLHSSQYFQCARVLQYPAYAEALCRELARRIGDARVDAVIAPALGGIVVGQEVGRQLNVRSMFTERTDGRMQLRRSFEIGSGEKVLVCEDVITTGRSVREVIDIVEHHDGIVVGVAAILDRSDGTVELPNLITALQMHVDTYNPGVCPLCKRGVPIEKPGSRVTEGGRPGAGNGEW